LSSRRPVLENVRQRQDMKCFTKYFRKKFSYTPCRKFVSSYILECNIIYLIFCVGVVYSGEYDVCDVTLSVYLSILSIGTVRLFLFSFI
jgi:hypothetical protein